MDSTFDPAALADDLVETQRIYADLFATVDTSQWDKPPDPHGHEWTLHETIAHLCALNGAGLDSIIHTLDGEPYAFRGLDTRDQLDHFNRTGIDDHLNLAPDALFAEFDRVHGSAARIARSLRPEQAQLTSSMPIYNRPVQISEALGIIVMHAGLIHTAQVAEPANWPPLWTQLTPEIRHRQIGRVMRAFSLLYRHDVGDPIRACFAFTIGGPGGGRWYVMVSPEATASGEGCPRPATLTIRLRNTDDFCRMMTGRFNLPWAIVSRRLRLRGDRRLFLRMNKLFSTDAP